MAITPSASSSNTYEDFIKAFYPKSGLDLKFYKQGQMERRIISFRNAHGFQTFPDFLKGLSSDPVLYDAFFKHLTINVSQFFRDANQWVAFREKIVPIIYDGKNVVKLWSAGCSSGQEPYTMAMTMLNWYPNVKFSVLATDIDVNVIKQAKEGIYKQNDFASTAPEITKKFFTVSGGNYQVNDTVKRNVNFQHQNLLTDSFQTGFDCIACRNVVIYFTDEAKTLLYTKFVNSLKPGGILFTGSTEHLFNISQLGLKSVSSFFYQKI